MNIYGINKSIATRLGLSLLLAFAFSHMIVSRVIYTNRPVIRHEFVIGMKNKQIALIQNTQRFMSKLAVLPKTIVRIPSFFKKNPSGNIGRPYFFIPPPEWLANNPKGGLNNPTLPAFGGGGGGGSNPLVPTSNYVRPTTQQIPQMPTRSADWPYPTQPTAPGNPGNGPGNGQPGNQFPTSTPAEQHPGTAPNGAAQQLLDLINGERQRLGRGQLSFDERLNHAAQNYADIIGPAGVCSHTYGSDFTDRFRQAGYPVVSGGENITCGISSPQAAFTAWMNSPGHHDNMLNASWKSVGLGYSSGYWVLDLGPI